MAATLNFSIGWLLIVGGFLSGMLLGLFFARDGWLGGYDAWPRRLLRLGHIAMVALGMLNVLFALSLPYVALAPWEYVLCSWGFIIGGVSMPVVCGVSAWNKPLRALFPIPVASLLTAAITFCTAIIKYGVSDARHAAH